METVYFLSPGGGGDNRRFLVIALEAVLGDDEIFSSIVADGLTAYVEAIRLGMAGNAALESLVYFVGPEGNRKEVKVKTLAVLGEIKSPHDAQRDK